MRSTRVGGHDTGEASVGLTLEHLEELATCAKVHDEVEVVLCLERVVESHDKGVVGRGQDLPLRECPLDLCRRESAE